MFSLICARINGWVKNGEAGDLRCYHAHYDVTVMNMRNVRLKSKTKLQRKLDLASGNHVVHWSEIFHESDITRFKLFVKFRDFELFYWFLVLSRVKVGARSEIEKAKGKISCDMKTNLFTHRDISWHPNNNNNHKKLVISKLRKLDRSDDAIVWDTQGLGLKIDGSVLLATENVTQKDQGKKGI